MAAKKTFSLISTLLLASACLGGSIKINELSLHYTEDFSSLGSGNVTWVDGTTVTGWYMKSVNGNYGQIDSNGIPEALLGITQVTGGTGIGAYNISPNADQHVIAWHKGNASNRVYFGLQLQNTLSHGIDLVGNVTFNMQQWKANGEGQVILQYLVTDTGGNNLDSNAQWRELVRSNLPNTTTGPIDGTLESNQFTLSASLDGIHLNTNQYLTFRTYTLLPNGVAIGVDSAEVNIQIPEQSQAAALVAATGGALAALIARRRRKRQKSAAL